MNHLNLCSVCSGEFYKLKHYKLKVNKSVIKYNRNYSMIHFWWISSDNCKKLNTAAFWHLGKPFSRYFRRLLSRYLELNHTEVTRTICLHISLVLFTHILLFISMTYTLHTMIGYLLFRFTWYSVPLIHLPLVALPFRPASAQRQIFQSHKTLKFRNKKYGVFTHYDFYSLKPIFYYWVLD